MRVILSNLILPQSPSCTPGQRRRSKAWWTMGEAPLRGIKILDLSQVVSGPFGTMILADQGATVLKVEPMGTPDTARNMGRQGSAEIPGIAGIYVAVNRGKRSLAIDLKTPEGYAAILRLCRTHDVIVSNFRPGAMEKLGLSFGEVKAANPNIIYVTVTGFGPTGPYSRKPIYDPIIQGVSGMCAMQQDWGACATPYALECAHQHVLTTRVEAAPGSHVCRLEVVAVCSTSGPVTCVRQDNRGDALPGDHGRPARPRA